MACRSSAPGCSSPATGGMVPHTAVDADGQCRTPPSSLELCSGFPVTAEDFACPICLEVLQDPFVTSCGHTFCYGCISTHIQSCHNCPCCSRYVSKDHLFPNFLLSKVVGKAAPLASRKTTPFEQVYAAVSDERFLCTPEQLDALAEAVQNKKAALQDQEAETNMELLLQFLQYSREEKAKRLQHLHDELSCLERDIEVVCTHKGASDVTLIAAVGPEGSAQLGNGSRALHAHEGDAPPSTSGSTGHTGGTHAQQQKDILANLLATTDGATSGKQPALALGAASMHHEAGTSAGVPRPYPSAVVASTHHQARRPRQPPAAVDNDDDDEEMCSARQRHKRQRLTSQFEDLQRCYLQLRSKNLDALLLRRAAGGCNGGSGSGVAAAAAVTNSGAAAAAAVGVGNGASLSCTSGGMQSHGKHPQAAAVGSDEAAVAMMAAGSNARLGNDTSDFDGLAEFSRLLSVFSSCSSLQVVGSVRCANTGHATSILSSIEFDRDGELFATGGVCKRISVYNFRDVIASPGTDAHPPVNEIVTRSKLTSLSWNPYVKSHLISSDYEGVVSLWDVPSSKTVLEYEAHEKRIWSVDFCRADPMMFVSGSDDGWVKVWSTKQPGSVADIDVKANVCCVQYNPRYSHEVAVGSADHQVHVYDLRNLRQPVHLFAGHRKAVSYVKYMSPTEVASASTDGTLRLWDLTRGGNTAANTAAPPPPAAGVSAAGGGGNPVRTFRGHTNEKNFVGMAASEEFLACGSETNEVFVYFKALGSPVARKLFEVPPPAAGGPPSEGQFISSVTWQPNSRMLVAANCMGFIKIMRLTG